MKVTISLGSNTSATENMHQAKVLLRALLPDIVFGEEVWTEPYPTVLVPHPTARYLNCLAHATTSLPQDRLAAELKRVETALGDNHANHQKGIVLIDIDLLTYGDRTLKQKLW